jgi:hypothetical protein
MDLRDSHTLGFSENWNYCGTDQLRFLITLPDNEHSHCATTEVQGSMVVLKVENHVNTPLSYLK